MKLGREKALSDKEAIALHLRKMRKALQILLFRTHRKPGIKGWELRRALGKDYMKIIDLANKEIGRIGLEIKILPKDISKPLEKLSKEELREARFFIAFKEPLKTLGASGGWRIDDIAMLSAIVAYIASKHGKASRKEVEELLASKFLRWRVSMNIDRFIRRGYLSEEAGVLSLDWRTIAEVDLKSLLSLIIGASARKALK